MSALVTNESTELFRNAGYCHCCRSETVFVAYSAWLRDNYICSQCHSIPRQRHLQYVLDEFFPNWEGKAVHESSPSNKFISQYCQDYSSSQYLDGIPLGDISAGVRCESIEDLTFDSDSIDIFITQDVLEHVFHPGRAIAEIMRVLRPGGAHIFTAPKHKGLLTTLRRAHLRIDGSIDYIHKPNYHGNPVGDGRALVTFDYGYDFEVLLSEWANSPVQAIHTKNISKGIDAEFNEVFVIRKTTHQALDTRPAKTLIPAT
jgi:SAM-dependent methyltransferase